MDENENLIPEIFVMVEDPDDEPEPEVSYQHPYGVNGHPWGRRENKWDPLTWSN